MLNPIYKHMELGRVPARFFHSFTETLGCSSCLDGLHPRFMTTLPRNGTRRRHISPEEETVTAFMGYKAVFVQSLIWKVECFDNGPESLIDWFASVKVTEQQDQSWFYDTGLSSFILMTMVNWAKKKKSFQGSKIRNISGNFIWVLPKKIKCIDAIHCHRFWHVSKSKKSKRFELLNSASSC